MTTPPLSVGQKIELNDGRTAIIRFLGQTHFQTGEWVGVELEDASGKNDGSVKGERYFECEMGYGMFLRAGGVRGVLEQARDRRRGDGGSNGAGAERGVAGGGGVSGATGARARPTSFQAGAQGAKRGETGTGAARRSSAIVGAPSPATGAKSAVSGLRSPTKSPTKQLGATGVGSGSASRMGTPPAPGRRPGAAAIGAAGAKPRSSVAASSTVAAPGRRTSTVPAAGTAGTRGSRSSLAPAGSARAPASRAPPGRAAGRAPPAPAGRIGPGAGAGHRLSGRGLEETEDEGSPQSDLLSPRESNISSAKSASEPESAQDGEDETVQANFAPPAPPPIPPDPPQKTAQGRRTSSPPASMHSQKTVKSTAQSTRQIEELEAKVRLLERKRLEDRDLKRTMEQAQQERDKYQAIIEKLQKKYQPQQQEITDLKKALSEAEGRFEGIEELQAEHDSIMEMATLDKEMAEETAESLKAELETLRTKQEELEMEVEVLREENDEYSKEMSPEERTSAGWLQMEKENERLRNALLRLRDLTQDREGELKEQIGEMKAQIKDLETMQLSYDEMKEKLLISEANADDLRQQLEAALGAEEMIEELTEQNMGMQERQDELRATIEDLENLKELNDELELNHVEAEKQMQDEIDFKDSLLVDRERTARQQQESLDDADYTINRFRELVSTLQSDLQDMQASKQISDTEAADLSTKSRAMLDLNLKLQSSAAKTQVKTIDLELRKLDAQEASEHLAIVQLFLPEAFHAERDSVLALLRFKRIGFKANLVQSFIRERVASFGSRGWDENVFAACDVLDKLTWVAGMADRFVNSICACSVEEFAGYEGALYELEPVERALNGYIDGLRRDDVREKDMAEELQRSIAVMTHLSGLHVQEDLASHSDDLLMRTLCLQSQLESTASALGLIRNLIQGKLPVPDSGSSDDEDSAQDVKNLVDRAEALISHARSAKVMAGKTHRALSDLQVRSLTLEASCTDTVASAESITQEIAAFAREAGSQLQSLFGEEGRSEPFTPYEASSTLTRAATTAFALPTSEAGPFATLNDRLRQLSETLSSLATFPTDLDNTIEFERAPAPWVARADQLKQTKLTSIDTEAELARTLESVRERDVVLKSKETELEEQSVRIEMLEARMKDASKRSARIAELERALHDAHEGEKRARGELAQAKRDALQDVERAREELGRMAEQRGKRSSGREMEADAMGAGAQLTLKTQEMHIKSLQGAVRFLQAENQRLRLPAPDSLVSRVTSTAWLHESLVRPKSEHRKRQDALHKEGTEVQRKLLQIGSEEKPQIVELDKLPMNKLAWRPMREHSRWRVERRREEWEDWREWRREVLRKAAVVNPRGVHRAAGRIEGNGVAGEKPVVAREPKILDAESAEVSSAGESDSSE